MLNIIPIFNLVTALTSIKKYENNGAKFYTEMCKLLDSGFTTLYLHRFLNMGIQNHKSTLSVTRDALRIFFNQSFLLLQPIHFINEMPHHPIRACFMPNRYKNII